MVRTASKACGTPLTTLLGKIVRIGPNRISVNSPQALPDIYGTSANVQKSQVYGSFKHFFGNVDMSMTMINKKAHAARRRVTVQALTAPKVKAMEGKMLDNIRYFCHSLASQDAASWSKPRDITKLAGYLVSDIMGDLTFSKNWDVQRSHKNRHFVEELPLGVAGIHLVSQEFNHLTLRSSSTYYFPLRQDICLCS